jgi:hypothetical protein
MNEKIFKFATSLAIPTFIFANFCFAKIPEHIEISNYSHQNLGTTKMTDSGSSFMNVSGKILGGIERVNIIN